MLKEEIVQVLLKSVNIYKDYIVKGSISIEDRLEKEKLIDKLSLEHASLKEELESGDYAEGYTSLDDIDEEEKSISKKLQEKFLYLISHFLVNCFKPIQNLKIIVITENSQILGPITILT